MNELRMQAHIKLTEQLLDYTQEEEVTLLEANAEPVKADLLKVMRVS